MRNELSKDLSVAEGKEQYDAQCKKVLSNKVILAWILMSIREKQRENFRAFKREFGAK